MSAIAQLVLLMGLLPGQAPATAAEDLKLEVRRLVRQLDAAQLGERDAAEEALVQLGPAALDALPKPDARTSAEAAQRLARVRKRLERAAAEAVARPALVTLAADALPLSKALAALSEQSGNAIVDYRKQFGQATPDPPLKLAFDKTPFWQALDETLDRAGLTVYAFGTERAIHVVARGPDRLPRAAGACYCGPLRIEPVEIVAKRDLRQPGGESLTLELYVAWEPRLRPISLRQRLADLEATDEKGQPLTAGDATAGLESAAGDDRSAVPLRLPLKLPPRGVQQIARLKGKIEAILPGRTETFTFGDLPGAKGIEQRAAGVAVTLDEVRKNNDLWQVRVRVKFDEAGEAMQTHRGWVFKNEVYLETPDGKRLPPDVFETYRQTASEVGIAYGFDLDGPPAGYKFVYKTPGVLLATDFPFELKGIKLP